MKEGLKKLAYVSLLTGSAALGALIGRYSAIDREFKIQREGDTVSITAQELGKTYRIITHNGEAYMGDSNHHMKGLRITAILEGENAMKPRIQRLRQHNEQLEDRIKKRKFMDQIERLGDSIGDGYRNFKHNMLD